MAVAVVACYLVAGWWPFEFERSHAVTNGFSRTADGTLAFDGSSWAAGPASWVETAIVEGRVRLSLSVRAAAPHRPVLTHIFTVSRHKAEQNLIVGQRDDDLVVRLHRMGPGGSRRRGLVAEDVFAEAERWREIDVEVDGREASLSVDGREVVVEELGRDPLARWDPSAWVVLGNGTTLGFGWEGEIRRALVEVPSATVDYLRMPLETAEGHPVTTRQHLGWTTSAGDVAANVGGFVPLGLLLRRRSVVLVALLALSMSLTMEFGQLFLPMREPSAADLISNTAGAVFGTLAVRRLARERRVGCGAGVARMGYGPPRLFRGNFPDQKRAEQKEHGG